MVSLSPFARRRCGDRTGSGHPSPPDAPEIGFWASPACFALAPMCTHPALEIHPSHRKSKSGCQPSSMPRTVALPVARALHVIGGNQIVLDAGQRMRDSRAVTCSLEGPAGSATAFPATQFLTRQCKLSAGRMYEAVFRLLPHRTTLRREVEEQYPMKAVKPSLEPAWTSVPVLLGCLHPIAILKKTPNPRIPRARRRRGTTRPWKAASVRCLSGLWCCPLGHGHPKIAEAVARQVRELDYIPAFQMGHPRSFRSPSES